MMLFDPIAYGLRAAVNRQIDARGKWRLCKERGSLYPLSIVIMAVVERRIRDCRQSSYFLQYAKDFTSQGGEDGILDAIFACIAVGQSPDRPFCVDIGAWDGKHLSNTYSLLHDRGWGGLLCEADGARYETLSRLYAERSDIFCINSLVDSQSLMFHLTEHKVNSGFDFLSIDIDGSDYHLWKGLGNSFCPKVVCIEFNPTVPNHVVFIQANDARVQQGSSLLALVELGKTLAEQFGGYQLVCTTVFNAIFVRKDLCHLIPPGEYTLDALHSTSMITDIFQTYDGELKICGPKKLLWHRTALNCQKMQPLSKKQRYFPFAPPNNGDDLRCQFSTVETVLAEVVRHVNVLLGDNQPNKMDDEYGSSCTDVNGEQLIFSFEALRVACEPSCSAGASALAMTVECMLYSAALAAVCVMVKTSSLSPHIREACAKHVWQLSAALERGADMHIADKSNSSQAPELYEQALHVLAYIPQSAYGDNISFYYYESCIRLCDKLSQLQRGGGGSSDSDIVAATRKLYWLSQSQLFKARCPGIDSRNASHSNYRLNFKMLAKMGVTIKKISKNDLISSDKEDVSGANSMAPLLDHDIQWFVDDVGSVLHRACGRVNMHNRVTPSTVPTQNNTYLLLSAAFASGVITALLVQCRFFRHRNN